MLVNELLLNKNNKTDGNVENIGRMHNNVFKKL
jgi:hypothetical protein